MHRERRADSQRNHDAVLDTAHALFSGPRGVEGVSLADVAAAAGVGKGTVFRHFGDRAGLMGAVLSRVLEPLRAQLEDTDSPLGPASPPHLRIPAVLDTLLQVKLRHHRLALAVESSTGAHPSAGCTDPYRAAPYAWLHRALEETLRAGRGGSTAPFTAHVLLGSVRADLLHHLTVERGLAPQEIRDAVRSFALDVLAHTGTAARPTARPGPRRERN
ncbi:TetR/AcrR family transcriptional regulator [Streptomyces sp. NPDC090106]|uniref:TetR/AcrR family transcriptional regulator n=1 Tax=Streptomyces sp. NPDC090106 TaxID=3365946 RepID=UPI0038129E7C